MNDEIYPFDFLSLKPEDLHLIHFADVAMTTRPREFDFTTHADSAAYFADLLKQKCIEFGGVGLSANQVGIPYRVFTFGVGDTFVPMFNPYIAGTSKETTLFREGCLSFPGFFLTLLRPASIVISFQDVSGVVQTAQYEGIPARIIQHEYDHMEGINFTNHASYYKMKHEFTKWKKQYIKQLRTGLPNANSTK